MNDVYPEGSVWRRWDPHVHTPGTVREDRYRGWDNFLQTVEENTDVIAIGATDYYSIRGYKRLKEYKANGRIPSIKFLFPNIEFRVFPPTKNGSGVNIHLLISPDCIDHIDKIEESLSRLVFTYLDQPYSCTEHGLTGLGYAYCRDNTKSKEFAYSEGVNQFKPTFDEFRAWYQKETWLKQN